MPYNTVHIALAFAEGFGLAFSPCILPVLPFILASSVTKNRIRPFLIITGFITTFTVFSLISRSILSALDVSQQSIQTGAYALLLMFGIVMLIPYLEERFARATSGIAGSASNISNTKLSDTKAGGFLVGALIGLIWVPCAGPILAAALLQVIQQKTSFDAIFTIASFSLGAGIPMLAVSLFGQELSSQIKFISRHAVTLRRVMGVIVTGFAVLALSGVSIAEWAVTRSFPQEQQNISGQSGLQNALKSPYTAAPIEGIQTWLNTDPIDLASLRGRVVLIDFWTYSCINCIRTLPYIKAWDAKYKKQGLVIIGIHSPEFAFEADPKNVLKAVEKFGIKYPVALDNNFSTWRNYENQYWPAHYLINKDGQVVYTHFGEGDYDVTENNIRFLLGLSEDKDANAGKNMTDDGQTPETYVGDGRSERQSEEKILPLHHWDIEGQWKHTPEYLESSGRNADRLRLHYRAKKVFLVMESADGTEITAKITNSTNPSSTQNRDITVREARLYELTSNQNFGEGTLSLEVKQPGLRIYAFTFGK